MKLSLAKFNTRDMLSSIKAVSGLSKHKTFPVCLSVRFVLVMIIPTSPVRILHALILIARGNHKLVLKERGSRRL